jgi:hypothetical protein
MRIGCLFLLLLFIQPSFGAVLNIGNNGTFTTSGNATYDGLTMGNSASLTVLSGHTLTINGSATSNNGLGITVQNGGTLIITGCLTGNNNFNLNIAGSITLGCIDVDNNGSLTVQGTGNVNVSGNITTGTNTTINVNLNGQLTVGGNVTVGPSVGGGQSTVNVNGTFHIEGQYNGPLPTTSGGTGHMDDLDQTFLPVLLPLTLKNLTLDCDGNQGTLFWTTSSENNTSYFSVLTSENGFDWKVTGTVQAAGYSIEEVNYTYTLRDLPQHTSYVKLEQFDHDGLFNELGTLSMNCAQSDEITIRSYPNPSNGNFNVKIEGIASNEANLYKIRITDLFGRELFAQQTEISSSSMIIPFNEMIQEKGQYIIEISDLNGLRKTAAHVID